MYEINKDAVCNALFDTNIKANGKLNKAIDFGKYILTSGKISCMYANHRIIPQTVKNANTILNELENVVRFETDADYIISSADAGIYWGAIVANRLKLPFSLMRKDTDENGLNKHMGIIPEYTMNVVPVDDLNTTLGTINKVLKVVNSLGHSVPDYVLSVDREEHSDKNSEIFKEFGTKLHPLVTLKEIIDYGFEEGEISKDKLALVESYRKNPDDFAIKVIKEFPEWLINHPRLKKTQDYYVNNSRVKDVLDEVILKNKKIK